MRNKKELKTSKIKGQTHILILSGIVYSGHVMNIFFVGRGDDIFNIYFMIL